MRDSNDNGPKAAGPNPAPGAPVAASGQSIGVAPPPDLGSPNRPGTATRNPAGDRPPGGNIPDDFAIEAPSVSLPKGGGAIHGIGEKFTANPVTGTGSFSIPLPVTPARGKGPEVSLSYNSGAGNGAFGIGWSLSVPAIRRKTDRGLPRYIDDGEHADTFVMSGAEDLVPFRFYNATTSDWVSATRSWTDASLDTWTVTRYRPRVDDAFAIIERFRKDDDGDTFWRTITRDNTQRVYGRTAQARVVDPDNGARIFEWLLEEESDEIGNVTAYVYTTDSATDVGVVHPAEARRQTDGNKVTYVYLKQVCYGNTVPYASPLRDPNALPPRTSVGSSWTYPPTMDATSGAFRFRLVFDYGHHDPTDPRPEDVGHNDPSHDDPLVATTPWPTRQDAFSSFRGRFDLRCHRLCRRVLLFHTFDSLRSSGGSAVPAVTRSLEFSYDENAVATQLTSVTQTGWRWNGSSYDIAMLPSVDFGYSAATIDESIQFVDGLDDLPNGLDTSKWQWVDLDGEGMAGLLTQSGGGWFYKRNEGQGKLGAVQRLASKPNITLGQPGTRLVDLGGDGKLDVVVMRPDIAGYQERTLDGGWEPFRRFPNRLTQSLDDPNARLIDLDGDGIADVLVTEGNVFTWYPSKAKDGFDTSRRTFQSRDENKGPRVVFSNDGESIFLADMTGDGLTDIVRIRNGSICYWPNRGYGKFGAKVHMKGAPRFDAVDRFDPGRIRLADIDGAGPTDLLYVGPKGVQFWLNQSGNSFSAGTTLSRVPSVSSAESIQVADLRGDGTACLVWSSPLMRDAWQPLRYMRLMSEGKPYLLTSVNNNRGRETRLTYAPSTQFYTADRQAGTPWATRLAFPVQCLQKVEQIDHVTGWKFATTYAYHHGYFDGAEREFRGFGLVDQWDTESFSDFEATAQQSSQIEHFRPPVRTRTWFHTGAWRDDGTLSRAFLEEYYKDDAYWATVGDEQVYTGILDAPSIEDLGDDGTPATAPTFPRRTPDELREAYRALKGRMLRQEVYAEDSSDDADKPYTVTEQTFRVVRIQPQDGDGHGVFRVDARETKSFQYDRNPEDPRVSHQLTLELDAYGSPLRSATVSYPRRADFGPLLGASSEPVPLDEQTELHIVISENTPIHNDGEFANLYDPAIGAGEQVWHLGLPHTAQTYELTGRRSTESAYSDTNPATIAKLLEDLDGDPDGTGSDTNAATLIDFEDTATGGTTRELRLLSDQRVKYFKEDVAQGAESFGVVGVRAIPYQRYILAVTSGLFTDTYGTATSLTMANFRTEGGYVELNADGHAWIPTGTQTLDATAFFVPTTHTDPFGNDTTIVWDTDALAVTTVTDAKSNVTSASINYQTLSPTSVTDPNLTVSEVQTDALGRVTATYIYNGTKGDSPHRIPADDPTTYFTYTTSSVPNVVKVEAREGAHGGTATYQESYAYLDGGGAVVQTKSRVAAGDAPERDANGDLVFDGSGNLQWAHATVRWVGSGRVVLDNKGNVVKKYEPFFSSLSTFEDEAELAEWGVSPLFEYDPIGRNIKVTLPDGHFRSFVYNPWEVQAFDECDNEVGGDHENTPSITHLDAIGRVVQTWALLDDDWFSKRDDPVPANRIDPVGDDGVFRTRVELDVSGNPLKVYDPRGIEAATVYSIQAQTHDLLGRALFTGAADEGYGTVSGAGENRVAPDIAGQPVHVWRSGSLSFEMTYDELRRPVKRIVTDNGTTSLVEYRVYGEASGVPYAKGRPWKLYDTAGLHEVTAYDFKGNATAEERTVVDDMTVDVDWTNIDDSGQAATVISNILGATPTAHSISRTFDALGRLTQEVAPDGSVTTPSYDEGNRLDGLTVKIQSDASATTFIDSITYNARGQRLVMVQGDATGVHTTTTYTYDDERLWVTDIETERSSDAAGQLLQDLSYVRDACGNILTITDAAHELHYFSNTQVSPTRTFEYDALYRLVKATGREKNALGQPGFDIHTHNSVFPYPTGGGTVLENYEERYTYDKAGNITEMKHIPTTSSTWTREYDYEAANNQLKATTQIGGGSGNLNDKYYYNERGAMVFMPHLHDDLNTPQPTDNIARDFRDHIRRVTLDTLTNKAWYVYDAGGQRVGKRVEQNTTKTTLYLWGYEVFTDGTDTWTTLHVMDDQRRLALVECLDGGTKSVPDRRIRFQYTDHLGTASLECEGNDSFAIISYEEYHPYGSTAWYTQHQDVDVSKRYRFTGMERDDETGLQYHSQRYYAPWLGRWDRADPAALSAGPNRFEYVESSPNSSTDPTGLGPNDARGHPDLPSEYPDVVNYNGTPLHPNEHAVEPLTGERAALYDWEMRYGPNPVQYAIRDGQKPSYAELAYEDSDRAWRNRAIEADLAARSDDIGFATSVLDAIANFVSSPANASEGPPPGSVHVRLVLFDDNGNMRAPTTEEARALSVLSTSLQRALNLAESNPTYLAEVGLTPSERQSFATRPSTQKRVFGQALEGVMRNDPSIAAAGIRHTGGGGRPLDFTAMVDSSGRPFRFEVTTVHQVGPHEGRFETHSASGALGLYRTHPTFPNNFWVTVWNMEGRPTVPPRSVRNSLRNQRRPASRQVRPPSRTAGR